MILLTVGDFRYSKLILYKNMSEGRFWWPRGLRRGSAVPHMLGLRVRIPLGIWLSVSCECSVWSGRGLCDGHLSFRGVHQKAFMLFSVIMSENNQYAYVEYVEVRVRRIERKKERKKGRKGGRKEERKEERK